MKNKLKSFIVIFFYFFLLCKNVNYLTKTLVGDEFEYLFAPYSVFTIDRFEESSDPNYNTPHVISLTASLDNLLEPAGLPAQETVKVPGPVNV